MVLEGPGCPDECAHTSVNVEAIVRHKWSPSEASKEGAESSGQAGWGPGLAEERMRRTDGRERQPSCDRMGWWLTSRGDDGKLEWPLEEDETVSSGWLVLSGLREVLKPN